ncbi:MAG TPA: hypothetical protein VGO71_11140 [Baekduia sp.]|nr:hypothetical protein [Baekduia sp.]
MTKTRIAGAIAALAMFAAPAVASAHRGHDDNGRHHGRHHAKKAQVKDLPAGTVTSFTAGELTITLANNKTYTATVTDKTVIQCQTAAPQAPAPATATATARASHHGDDNDDQGDESGQPGDVQNNQDDDQDENDGNGDDNGNGRCTSADLVAGTKVTDADLSLSNGGTWKKIELLK